jgi:hypothetical protein
MNHLRRLWCVLFGCIVHDAYPVCERCGADLYGGPFVERGRLDRLQAAWWRLRRWTWPRCDHCGRRLTLLWWRRYTDSFCSPKCHDKWLPF